jgi:hypothetical protein
MSSIKAFEIHTFSGGQWKVDSVFDDRSLAIFEAQRMEGSGRFAAIRVVEEDFNEQSNRTTTRTIFRGSKVEANNAEALDRSRKARLKAVADRKLGRAAEAEFAGARRVERRQENSNPYFIVGVLTLLGLAAIGALIGLQYARGAM